ncbi:MAG: hypothetical protein WAN36_05510, partial [Calditrichia bacterium]
MKQKFSFFIITLLFLVSHGFSQSFGKNKIQYQDFEWYYIQSQHFDVYYYEGGEDIAEFTAEVAEDAYQQLKRDFSYEIRERIVIIVYK